MTELKQNNSEEQTPKVCSICQAYYTGWGNNAQPVNDGRCCNECNHIVVLARLRLHMRAGKPEGVK